MASLQVDAKPVEDVITETEAISKEPQVPPPPPPAESIKAVDLADEEGLQDLTASPYEEKVQNPDDEEEEKDIEYSSFMEREDAEPFRFRSAGEPPNFGDFNEDDDAEDDDDEA